jgi:hypothetical protein
LKNAYIALNYAGVSNITKNNFIDCGVMVWLSHQPICDGNYWSDYHSKYPDAMEIGISGIWDTPYNYGVSQGNYTDNNPSVSPIVTTLNENYPSLPTPSPSPIPLPTSTPSPTLSPTPILSPASSTSPSPSPSSPSPTLQETIEPEQSASPAAHGLQVKNFTPAIIILALATIAVGIGVLAYLAKRKKWK